MTQSTTPAVDERTAAAATTHDETAEQDAATATANEAAGATTDTPAFSDLGLSDAVLEAVRDLGYETPSPVQAQAIRQDGRLPPADHEPPAARAAPPRPAHARGDAHARACPAD